MREVLKNLFSNAITLENGDQYYYTVKPFELTNSLGTVIAVLQQYAFSSSGSITPPMNYNLYRTKEGNWYDVEPAAERKEQNIVRMLKSAIDKKEGETILE